MYRSKYQHLESIIEQALNEDIGTGDITTNSLIPESMERSATMVAKANGIIAGMEVAEAVFKYLSPQIIWKPFVRDGDAVVKGTLLVEMTGSFRALLTGERLALNFLQRMSGIATMTHLFVEQVAGFGIKILDTRKTVPGLRLLDKYAVKAGGGENHRIGLYDMVLIKDNHIKVAGGIKNAVEQIRKVIPAGMKIEVETNTLAEVQQALEMKADIIMLDNMSNEMMRTCAETINHRSKVEASGNMSLERVREVAATGVDYISIGALTHSVTALDISMNIKNN
ncbi:MAG: carboxylating nicotinate-nucleotide diphosphorylase [Prolixibacteraceae bacterium]|nr:carboxylating nicotinate-nucleotide diphosphorylase [Prolixibacteraceae bacterium]